MTLDARDRDPSVDPGVDFYRYANGGWLDTHPIPPGYGSWGAFEEISVRNEEILHTALQRADEAPTDDLDRLVGNHFASGMDVAAVEAAGVAPIQPFLDQAAACTSVADVWALLPAWHQSGILALFGAAVTVDHDDATRNLLWLVPAGLGLPDRDSYFDDSEAATALRDAYVAHVAAQLRNVASPTPDELAPEVLAFETRLAELHLTGEQRRDPDQTLNRRSRDELATAAGDLDLLGYLDAIGAGHVTSVNLQQPAYFAGFGAVLATTEIEVVRAYLTFHVVQTTAEALSATFDDEAFEFYGRRVGGKQSQLDRYKRVVAAVTEDLGEALGQLYVRAVFPPEAKDRAVHMVDAIVAEMRHSLEHLAWMSDETRARALAKLDALTVKIGYPDRWRDWSGLTLAPTGYAANRLAAARFEFAYQLGKLDAPVDETEWEMPPQVVNAYYHPTRNEIVFPAGILQPPMFDAAADDAVNLGGIGTVIAHEITHGFDDQGRRFDADGAFRDWWTEEDAAHFTALADRLAAQYDEYVVVDEVHVNGRLTLGENIADLGGLTLASRALTRLLAARGDDAAAPIDGLTPMQRLFLANATLWRANISTELQRTLAQVDVHSPRPLRVRGPVSNLAAFQAAFDLADDAPWLRPPAERIEIW